VVEECRRRRIVVPSPGALERLCIQTRYQARGEVQRRLTDGLSADQRRRLGRTTVQHVAGYERQRRHATLVTVALDLAASLTDQAVDLFDRLIGTMFRKANERHARAFQADGRAINEKVRLYARVGAALITARDNKQDAFDAITAGHCQLK